MRYTSLEILKLAGIENPESQVGKIGISIGGVTVNTPDHVINMQDATEVKVIFGKELLTVELPKQDTHSEDVQKAIDTKGKAVTAALKARKEIDSTEETTEEE